MLYAIISDIHGNLEALTSVMNALKRIRPDKIICLGDVVGYGANPEECCEIVREKAAITVMGNHEAAVLGQLDIGYFTQIAREAVLWTRRQLSPDTMKWIASLPMTDVFNNECTLVHGSLFHPDEYNYVQYHMDVNYNFEVMQTMLLFVGHSHFPLTFFKTDPITYTLASEIFIPPETKVLINAGSVGQPRDDNPDAAFLIYDSKKKMAKLHRVIYDVKKAADKICKANLPEPLARRLALGK